MIVLPLLGVGVAGFLTYRWFTSGTSGGSWTEDSANLNQGMVDFVNKLVTYISFPIVVTSGIRSPSEQASALLGKIRAGDSYDELRKLYGNSSAINEVLAAPQSQWTSVLQAQVARGVYLSPHMRANAIDIRAWNLTSSQKSAVVEAARQAGASTIIHEDPGTSNEHIHVTIGSGIGSTVLSYVTSTEGGTGMSWWQTLALVLGAGAAVAVAGVALTGGAGVALYRRLHRRGSGRGSRALARR